MDELFTLLYKKGYASKKLQCFEDVSGGLSVGQDIEICHVMTVFCEITS